MADSLLHNRKERIADLHFRLKYLLQEIEDLRLKVRKRNKIFWLIFLPISIVLYFCIRYYHTVSPNLSPSIIVGIGVVTAIAAMLVYFYQIGRLKRDLANNFYNKITPHIVSEFLPESVFNAHTFISEVKYYDSELFRKRVDRYNGKEYISGMMGQTSIEFSKIHSEYKTTHKTKNGGRRTRWHTIFKGVFLIADSNKHFNGKTFIFPDSAERMLGGVGRWMQEKFGSGSKGEMVYLENPVFEKLYVVYSDDPVEARYLLTPNVQQYFIDLADHIGKDKICACFNNGKLYIALSGHFDLFSFRFSKSVLSQETLEYYCQNLLDILSIVEILNLNTRIWGK